ncbi:hypothetical protein SRHO_G00075690 [Serrasalmus rhombeus]
MSKHESVACIFILLCFPHAKSFRKSLPYKIPPSGDKAADQGTSPTSPTRFHGNQGLHRPRLNRERETCIQRLKIHISKLYSLVVRWSKRIIFRPELLQWDCSKIALGNRVD